MSDDLKADLAKVLMEGDMFWPDNTDEFMSVALLHELCLIEYISGNYGWYIGCRVTEAGKRYIAGGD